MSDATARPAPPDSARPAAREEAKLVTFGCRLNAWESEVMRDHARAAGLDKAVILNSCAVTAEAERQLRQAIRRARREHPEAEIVVTGCAAQIDPARYAAMPEVDRVLGNAEKLDAAAWRGLATDPARAPRVQVDDIMAVRETAGHLVEGFAEKTRAFVQVQQGCDHRCTFCIIPFGRGPNRSVPIGEIVRQVRALVAAGVREVVLTGVDITAYGADLPGSPSLGQMMRRLLSNVPELPRLRLSSVDPVELDGEVFDLLAGEPRFMPHLHLSLQAADDLILKRMKRRHSRADALACIARARAARPDTVFGADIIAGFPTETEAMFRNTLDFVAEAGLTFLHVFPYSERPGTPAARMPAVPKPERKARAQRLRDAGAAAEARFLASRVGRTARVLIESTGPEGALGRCEHYAPVRLAPHPDRAAGALVELRLTGVAQGRLLGEPTVEVAA